MDSPAPNLLKLLSFLVYCFIFGSAVSTLPKEALPTKSGYLPVGPATSSAIFYTYYEAQNPVSSLQETPLLIWLQGGPGCSSMTGNFFELGPWRLNPQRQNVEQLKLEKNSGSWNRLFGLLFLDNPIGTGFSIASKPEEIPREQTTVAQHLFVAITSFISSDPLFKSRPIYITGESYAGKYVPSIGYHILKKNAQLPMSKRVHLAGCAIGNGLTDPITQVATHAAHAHFSGLINVRQKSQLEQAQQEAVELIKKGNWSLATDGRREVLRLLQNMTGLATLYDFTRKVPYKTDLVTKFLESKEVKEALRANVSITWEDCSDTVNNALHEDVMKSVRYKVEYLVNKSKVLLYQGHFDLRDGVFSVESWVKKMKWDGIGKYLSAERKVWKLDGKLAGYVQKWASLSQVVVLGAGHFVPADQASSSQAMIEDWVMERGMYRTKPSMNSSV